MNLGMIPIMMGDWNERTEVMFLAVSSANRGARIRRH